MNYRTNTERPAGVTERVRAMGAYANASDRPDGIGEWFTLPVESQEVWIDQYRVDSMNRGKS